jgi:hypothetical protein
MEADPQEGYLAVVVTGTATVRTHDSFLGLVVVVDPAKPRNEQIPHRGRLGTISSASSICPLERC